MSTPIPASLACNHAKEKEAYSSAAPGLYKGEAAEFENKLLFDMLLPVNCSRSSFCFFKFCGGRRNDESSNEWNPGGRMDRLAHLGADLQHLAEAGGSALQTARERSDHGARVCRALCAAIVRQRLEQLEPLVEFADVALDHVGQLLYLLDWIIEQRANFGDWWWWWESCNEVSPEVRPVSRGVRGACAGLGLHTLGESL